MTMRVCSRPGCPTIYAGTESRCPTHTRVADRARGTTKERGYSGPGHRGFRDAVLERDTWCVLCGMEATVADHYPLSRKELVDAGMDPNDPEHGRALCKTDHDRETASSTGQRGGWNQRD